MYRARDLVPGRDQRLGEGLVVDMQRQALQLALRAAPELLRDGREQNAIGLGVVEGLSGLVDRRNAAFGDQKRTGPRMALSLAAMNSPIARFSSTDVRISVTVGLCRYSLRP
jgi:hypothetical protein